MVTAVDHIENLRKQLLDKKRSKELELEEINEMIRVLGQAPRVLKGEALRVSQEEEPERSGARYNLTFAKDIEDYVSGLPFDEVIKINSMLDTLKKEKGLQGKPKSLYAYASQVLKRLATNKKLGLKHQDGVGYFRTRKSERDESDSTLVHSV